MGSPRSSKSVIIWISNLWLSGVVVTVIRSTISTPPICHTTHQSRTRIKTITLRMIAERMRTERMKKKTRSMMTVWPRVRRELQLRKWAHLHLKDVWSISSSLNNSSLRMNGTAGDAKSTCWRQSEFKSTRRLPYFSFYSSGSRWPTNLALATLLLTTTSRPLVLQKDKK